MTISNQIRSLKVAIGLLNSCKTNYAFFERAANNFIPLVRKQFPSFVQSWEKQNQSDNLITIANNELSEAFLFLWKHAQKYSKAMLTRELIELLRHIRGPCIILNRSLSQHVYWELSKLYCQYFSAEKAKSFAPQARKLVAQEEIKNFEENKDLDPSFLWKELTVLENAWKQKDHSFSFTWPRIRCPTAAEVGLKAVERYNKLALANTAKGFEALDNLSLQDNLPLDWVKWTNRKACAATITRLTDELENLLLQPGTKTPPAEKKYSSSSTEKDKCSIQDWCFKWWNDRKEYWGYSEADQGTALKALKKAIVQKGIPLFYTKYPDDTLRSWMRKPEANPIPKELRGSGRKKSAKKAKKG